jgi:hypothetical protein
MRSRSTRHQSGYLDNRCVTIYEFVPYPFWITYAKPWTNQTRVAASGSCLGKLTLLVTRGKRPCGGTISTMNDSVPPENAVTIQVGMPLREAEGLIIRATLQQAGASSLPLPEC